jgi:SAM-dependent methyltransferase
MSNWSAGYIADVGYTYGVYEELNPQRFRLAFLNAGLAFPEVGTACELGFGQGLSVNIHAAASVTCWHGTDFNPAQAGFAQEIAAASGADLSLVDQAFAEFGQRDDLPDFDFIGLHGIWSWVSDENRAVIVDFIRRKLKVGGVLYVSYNTLPGWAPSIPLRDLMSEHSTVMSPSGLSSIAKVKEAMGFVEKLFTTNPRYVAENPALKTRFEQLHSHSASYLAHEYFNRDWAPMSFSRMAEWLEPAKVSFACSASYVEHVDALNLSLEQRTLLADIPNPAFQQTVRDFMINRQFRKDYFIRGPRQLNAPMRASRLLAERVVLSAPSSEIPEKAPFLVGECKLSPQIYNPIISFLSDHKVRTIAEIMKACEGTRLQLPQVVEALVLLMGLTKLSPANDPEVTEKARPATRKLNAKLRELARGSNDIRYLASPVTGGAVTMDRFQLLFASEYLNGVEQPESLAAAVTRILFQQDQRMSVDGKLLETAEQHHAELTRRAKLFMSRLELYKALGILEV